MNSDYLGCFFKMNDWKFWLVKFLMSIQYLIYLARRSPGKDLKDKDFAIFIHDLSYNLFFTTGPLVYVTYVHPLFFVLRYLRMLLSLFFFLGMLVASIANLRHGGVHKLLRELCKNRLLEYVRGQLICYLLESYRRRQFIINIVHR